MLAVMAGLAIGALGVARNASAQDLTKRPGPQRKAVHITHADIYPVDREPIMDGYVVFDGGVIRAVGSMGDGNVPAVGDATVIDGNQQGGTRLRVYPGLISPYTRIGLEEMGMTKPSKDMNEAGDATPEVVAVSAVNPDSTLIPVARTNGVLVFGVFPTGGTFPGRASVISADGWTTEDMTIKRDAGQVVAWPMSRIVRAWWMDTPEEEQMKRIRESQERIKDTFKAAKSYIAAKDADPKSTPTDLRWEAMRGIFPDAAAAGSEAKKPALAKLPLFVEANDYDQILSALAFARQGGHKVVIVGGRDAVMASKQIIDAGASVIVNSVIAMPRRDDSPYDDQYTLPARLHAAGVLFCQASGEETPHERNLPYAAGMSIAHGLANAAALRSVTLSAAEILGVADRIGSVTTGKDATIIITDGDPLDVRTHTKMAFIQGRQVDLTNKQSALAEKYREKYKQMNDAAGAPDAPKK